MVGFTQQAHLTGEGQRAAAAAAPCQSAGPAKHIVNAESSALAQGRAASQAQRAGHVGGKRTHTGTHTLNRLPGLWL